MIEYCPKCGTAVNGLIRTTNPAQYGVQCPVCGWERIDGICETPEIKRVITNADRIRAMTDEELAEFMCHNVSNGTVNCAFCGAQEFCRMGHNGWLDWLKQEVSDD